MSDKKRPSDTDRILHECALIREDIAALKRCCCHCHCHHERQGHTQIHVVSVTLEPKEIPMPQIPDHMPDFVLPASNIDAGLAVVNPRKADGSPSGPGTWTSSDTNALPVEPLADTFVVDADGNPVLDDNGQQQPIYNVRARTPLTPDPGTTAEGIVTWSNPSMVPVDIKVKYGDPALGHAAITAVQIPDEA